MDIKNNISKLFIIAIIAIINSGCFGRTSPPDAEVDDGDNPSIPSPSPEPNREKKATTDYESDLNEEPRTEMEPLSTDDEEEEVQEETVLPKNTEDIKAQINKDLAKLKEKYTKFNSAKAIQTTYVDIKNCLGKTADKQTMNHLINNHGTYLQSNNIDPSKKNMHGIFIRYLNSYISLICSFYKSTSSKNQKKIHEHINNYYYILEKNPFFKKVTGSDLAYHPDYKTIHEAIKSTGYTKHETGMQKKNEQKTSNLPLDTKISCAFSYGKNDFKSLISQINAVNVNDNDRISSDEAEIQSLEFHTAIARAMKIIYESGANIKLDEEKYKLYEDLIGKLIDKLHLTAEKLGEYIMHEIKDNDTDDSKKLWKSIKGTEKLNSVNIDNMQATLENPNADFLKKLIELIELKNICEALGTQYSLQNANDEKNKNNYEAIKKYIVEITKDKTKYHYFWRYKNSILRHIFLLFLNQEEQSEANKSILEISKNHFQQTIPQVLQQLAFINSCETLGLQTTNQIKSNLINTLLKLLKNEVENKNEKKYFDTTKLNASTVSNKVILKALKVLLLNTDDEIYNIMDMVDTTEQDSVTHLLQIPQSTQIANMGVLVDYLNNIILKNILYNLHNNGDKFKSDSGSASKSTSESKSESESKKGLSHNIKKSLYDMLISIRSNIELNYDTTQGMGSLVSNDSTTEKFKSIANDLWAHLNSINIIEKMGDIFTLDHIDPNKTQASTRRDRIYKMFGGDKVWNFFSKGGAGVKDFLSNLWSGIINLRGKGYNYASDKAMALRKKLQYKK